ncbi:nuclear transport factor 2 family protein [Aestuariivirga sp.]|uniref:nuclear transport factor 2 family protein n=1 Tax=Aestuariivirga sp. TaxID=2650926 RepID=UPI0039E70F4F
MIITALAALPFALATSESQAEGQTKPTTAEKTATVKTYVESFNRGDAEGMISLFATDGSIEDPAGSQPRKGRQALEEFYASSFKVGVKIGLDGDIRSSGDYVAFPL